MSAVEPLLARGGIGGRTVRVVESGAVECHTYPIPAIPDGHVLVRTVRSAISSGTEQTFLGRSATNVYLRKRWDEALRLFVSGDPTIDYPIVFGYRAAGEVVESRVSEVSVGARVFGRWPHTEFTILPASTAAAQSLSDRLTFDDGVDLAHMAPICLNAVAHAEGAHVGAPAVVFGAGVVGLITAQLARATGASTVYVVDRVASRLAIAEGLGLVPIDADAESDLAARLKRAHGADGIPVAFDCSGTVTALQMATRVVRRRGAVVAAGFYQGDARGLFLGEEFHHNGVQLRSAQIGNLHPSWTLERARHAVLDLVLARQLVLGELPRLVLRVEEVASGFAALEPPADVLQVALDYR